MPASDNLYATRLFLNAVIPLLKEINAHYGYFKRKNGVVQLSVQTPQDVLGTHFVAEDGQLRTVLGLAEKADVTLHFGDENHFIAFFRGKSKKLPAVRGWGHPGLVVATFRSLLKMAALLGSKTPPQDAATKALVVKLFFYLLSTGISQLNKSAHPQVAAWAQKSPDRVYAWAVDEAPDAAAYLRVKAGQTRAARGHYTRSKPFFTMRFATLDSALAILLGTGDMLALTAQKQLIMEGAPEFGAKIGDYMLLVASYVQ